MPTQTVSCPNCRTQNLDPGGRCSNCGTLLPISPMPMRPVYQMKPAGADKKIAAGLCAILLGGLGIHKFVLGYNTEGIIMLAASIVGGILTCGIVSAIVGVIGIVEGIMYLTKSDEEFVQTYIVGKKPWF
jgi:TM2 domain-containing membrane protein YozV